MAQEIIDGQQFDVIIVGGGPSGSSCASFLAKKGRKVLLLDKAKFPRDKICGDGISGKSVKVLQELDLLKEMQTAEHLKMYGVTFSSPKGTVIKIQSRKPDGQPPGFVCRREVFDNIVFQHAKKLCFTLEQFVVNDLVKEGDQVIGVTGLHLLTKKRYTFKAKVVVGADGASSIITSKAGLEDVDENHQIVGIRAYYTGVKDLNDTIELHFIDEMIPGYFWIFPLANGIANVGAGMITADLKKSKINLQEAMNKAITQNKLFKDRFVNAKQLTQIKSWSLPVGSKRRKLHANGVILVGDAAGLIDPFTGEGIGNALTSGKIAAECIEKALEKNDFSAAVLKEYEDILWKEVGTELKTSYKLQKLGKHVFLLNFVIDKAKKSKVVQEAISNSLINPQERDIFRSPSFYLKALFS